MDTWDEIELKSGTVVYANNLILGIGAKTDVMVHQGYDGDIYISDYTKEDMIEICEIAIARWQRLKRDLLNE